MPRPLSLDARPPSGRGTALLGNVSALLLGAAIWLALPPSTACSSFTATDAALVEGADVGACALLSLIPVAGGFLGAACVGEEPAVRAAIEHAVTTSASPDAGPPPLAAPAHATRLGAPLFAMRGGKRRQIGRAPANFTPPMVALAQAHLDAHGSAP